MNRSTFLKTLGLGVAGGMTAPLAARPLTPSSSPQVRITDVKAYLFKKACYIKVETDAGISGWGESDGANKKITPLYLDEGLKPYLLGKDPFDSEGIWHEAYLKGLEAGIGGLHPGTLAGVDNALVIKCGGITECRKVASMAHAFGKQVMVHNAKPTLATAASLQLLASIPNGARFQEYAGKRLDQGYGPLYELFDSYFTFEEGYLHLPDAPGLGLPVNEKAMEKHRLNQ